MQEPSAGPAEGLGLTLKIIEPVIVGLSVIAVVMVMNHGNTPQTISSRLNLSEGDLEIQITGADGNQLKVTGAGMPPDTSLNIVTLAPGEQIVSAINLLSTSIGDTFPVAGNYTMKAVFYPGRNISTVYSGPVTVTARQPRAGSEEQAAKIVETEMVKNAIVKAEKDYAPEQLLDLATNYRDTLDGKLASLLMSNNNPAADNELSSNEVYSSNNPIIVALWITSLTTPFSRAGHQLKESFDSFLQAAENKALGNQDTDSENKFKASKIINGQPFLIADPFSI